MQKNLTKLTENIEFILHQMAEGKMEVEIWQPLGKGQKVVFSAKAIKTDANEIFFSSKKLVTDLIKTEKTYCYIPKLQTVFKSKITFLSEYKIALSKPDYYVIRESREFERIDYSDQNIKLNYHLGEKTPNIHRLFSLKAKLLNATEKGLAMGVGQVQLNRFYLDDIVTIKAKQGSKMAVIRHISPYNGELYTIGMEYI